MTGHCDHRKRLCRRPTHFRPLFAFISIFLLFFIAPPVAAYEITLAWNQSPGSDIGGYAVYCRKANESYNYSIPAWSGNRTQCALGNLTTNTLYYFVARAYTTEGVQSDDSNEVSYFRPSDTSGTVTVSLTPELLPEEVPDSDQFSLARWQIGTDPDFAADSLSFDVTGNHFWESLTVPDLLLDTATEYFWRVRYVSESQADTEWSAPVSFTTSAFGDDQNRNGIPDDRELQVESDTDIDLDRNGIPDVFQPDIKCIRTENGNAFVGITVSENDTSEAKIESLQIKPIASEDMEAYPEPGVFPFGMLTFQFGMERAENPSTVVIHFSASIPAEASWMTYSTTEGWLPIDGTVVTVDSHSIELEIEDGASGDNDGLSNRKILALGGLFIPDSYSGSVSASPASPSTAPSSGSGGCFIFSLF